MDWICLNNDQESVIDGSVVFALEPFHGFLFRDFVFAANACLAASSKTDSSSGSLEDDVEIHAENTSVRVVLHSQVDVLLDAEAEAA